VAGASRCYGTHVRCYMRMRQWCPLCLRLSTGTLARLSVLEHIQRYQPSTTYDTLGVAGASTSNFTMRFVDVLGHCYLLSCLCAVRSASHPGTKTHNILQDWRAARCNPKLRALPSSSAGTLPSYPGQAACTRDRLARSKIPTLRLSGKLPINCQ
jgi:hypothetical protein